MAASPVKRRPPPSAARASHGCGARPAPSPPARVGRRHTNIWDGLGWRGYFVNVDKDNMSALNVMQVRAASPHRRCRGAIVDLRHY
jgi:hypothetical protein